MHSIIAKGEKGLSLDFSVSRCVAAAILNPSVHYWSKQIYNMHLFKVIYAWGYATETAVGNKNVIADALSRRRSVPTEWTLHRPTLQQVFNILDTPHIDLFASHLNNQLPVFCTCYPHPQVLATDAHNIDWTNILGYAFPPNISADKSCNKDRERKMQNHPHCSSVASPGLVHQTSQPPHWHSYIAPKTTRPPFPTHVRAVTPRPGESSSVSLDAIKLTLRQTGLSEDAASLAAKSRCPSTRRT